MSLLAMPFVETGADTGLHIVASVVMIVIIVMIVVGFWKIHELPLEKAHREKHHQTGLITILTWIGFVWHWVWVVAVFIAFVDLKKTLRTVRDIWQENTTTKKKIQTKKIEE